MLIGVPAESTAGETRVAVTPETARKLTAQGHTILVAAGAGRAASATDEAYMAAGAQISDQLSALRCDLVLKVRNMNHEEACPVLVTEEMVRAMKAGSVIIDLAAPQGGNCPLTEPNRTVVEHGVTLIGETNLPALVAADASALYARNVPDFLKLILSNEGGLKVDMEDDIVAACLVTRDGQVTRK